jgi:hypothetical protein
MKILRFSLLIGLIIPMALFAQAVPPLTEIDFSDARVSQGGTESFYLKNVAVSDQTYSLTIALGDDGFWAVTDISPESDSAIPAEIILDFATIKAVDDTSLKIDWIIYNGGIVSGVLSLSDDGITVFEDFAQHGSFSDSSIEFPEELSNLLVGRDTSAAEAELAGVRAEYEKQIADLQSLYDTAIVGNADLASENTGLKTQIAGLLQTNEELQSRIAEMISDVDAAAEGNVSIPEALASRYVDKLEDLEEEIGALRTQIASLEGRIDRSEGVLVEAIASQPSVTAPPVSDSLETIALRKQVTELRERNSTLVAEMESLEKEIRSVLLQHGFIAVLKPTLTRTLATDFTASEAQLGLWHVGPDRASQIDSKMLFGKLLLPVSQGDDPVLYSFKARSTDPPDKWVGFGLHIYVDGVVKRGYGLGDSLLVWLTRDQEVYKTNYTYLQLYRSDDDVHMDRVMDAVIPEPITETTQVDVLYQPIRQYITISVNGEEKIRYKTWFGIDEGVEVALRSLGTAEFTDLEVLTLP